MNTNNKYNIIHLGTKKKKKDKLKDKKKFIKILLISEVKHQ